MAIAVPIPLRSASSFAVCPGVTRPGPSGDCTSSGREVVHRNQATGEIWAGVLYLEPSPDSRFDSLPFTRRRSISGTSNLESPMRPQGKHAYPTVDTVQAPPGILIVDDDPEFAPL